MKATAKEIVELIKSNISIPKWNSLLDEFGYQETAEAIDKIFDEENRTWDKEIKYTYYLDEGFIELIVIDVLKLDFDFLGRFKEQLKQQDIPKKKKPNPYDYDSQSEYESALLEVYQYNNEVDEKIARADEIIEQKVAERQEELDRDEQEKRVYIEKYKTNWKQEAYKKYAQEHPLKAKTLAPVNIAGGSTYNSYKVRAIPIIKEEFVHIKE